MADPRFAAFREVTSYVRPPHGHGCPPVEVMPGVWTAHYHDIETLDKLKAAAPPTTLVVNAAKVDKCPTGPGSYGEGVDVLCIDGLLDDPDALKKAHAARRRTRRSRRCPSSRRRSAPVMPTRTSSW